MPSLIVAKNLVISATPIVTTVTKLVMVTRGWQIHIT